jgi:chitodextrinase
VKACDAGLNCSAASSALNVSTIDDVAPSAPQALRVSKVLANALHLTWNASTDNVAVQGYRVFVNGVARTTVNGRTAHIGNLAPNTEYTFTVRAFDAQKNSSTVSTTLTVTTGTTIGTIVDVSAPSIPANVVAENITTNSFGLKWDASTDNVSVKEYEVYRNGKLLGKTAHPAFRVIGVAPGRNTAIEILAVDHSGNKSSLSSTLTVTTLLSNVLLDTTAPTVPSGLAASAITSNGFRVTWNASTDDVFTLGYNVYLNGKFVATVGGTSYTFSGLSMSSAHNVQILAFDASFNRSARSTALQVQP